jgi:hypothetical protein
VSARRVRRAAVGLLTLALCAAMPVVAFALASSAGATATPLTAKSAAAATSSVTPALAATPASLEVQLWPSEPDGSVLVVGVELPAGTKLPASVRVPVPAGANVTWVGEVFGGDPSADVEVAYTKEKGVGGDVLVATLTKSRSLQYEATLPAPAEAAGRFTSTVEWVQSAPAPQVGLSVKTASTAGDVRVEPASPSAPQTNASGERLYTLPPAQLALGKSVTLKVSWITVAPGTASSTTAGSASPVLYVLAALLVIALLALAVVMLTPRKRA